MTHLLRLKRVGKRGKSEFVPGCIYTVKLAKNTFWQFLNTFMLYRLSSGGRTEEYRDITDFFSHWRVL